MIEVHCIRLEKPGELFLMENEEVIQTFSPDASQKAFTDSICAERVRYGVRSTLMPLVVATCKTRPEFPVIIPNEIVRSLPIRSRFPQLLCYPLIGRSARHIYVHDFPRFQFDDEESKKRTEEEIRDLQKITGPHLCRVIAQECLPTLATGSKWRDSASYTSEWFVYSPEYPA